MAAIVMSSKLSALLAGGKDDWICHTVMQAQDKLNKYHTQSWQITSCSGQTKLDCFNLQVNEIHSEYVNRPLGVRLPPLYLVGNQLMLESEYRSKWGEG